MSGRQGRAPSTHKPIGRGIGSGIANALGQVFGFGGSPGPQAQSAPQAQAQPSPRPVPIISVALQLAPLPPARPADLGQSPLPPARPSLSAPTPSADPSARGAASASLSHIANQPIRPMASQLALQTSPTAQSRAPSTPMQRPSAPRLRSRSTPRLELYDRRRRRSAQRRGFNSGSTAGRGRAPGGLSAGASAQPAARRTMLRHSPMSGRSLRKRWRSRREASARPSKWGAWRCRPARQSSAGH
jgi:hypothetical protein